MPDVPLAYFITFSTYGARLHGDTRGTSDRDHRAPDTPMVGYDERRWTAEKGLMRSPPFVLDAAKRRTVRAAIEEAATFRGWELYALNVRTNHVHVVVSAHGSPEAMMTRLKGRATHALRGGRRAGADQPVWGWHGSTRWLWDGAQLRGAVDYVTNAQGIPLGDGADNGDSDAVPGDPSVGLCFGCEHAEVVTSDRESTFWLCALSRVNLGFAKYPQLPVLRCRGYARKDPVAQGGRLE